MDFYDPDVIACVKGTLGFLIFSFMALYCAIAGATGKTKKEKVLSGLSLFGLFFLLFGVIVLISCTIIYWLF